MVMSKYNHLENMIGGTLQTDIYIYIFIHNILFLSKNNPYVVYSFENIVKNPLIVF